MDPTLVIPPAIPYPYTQHTHKHTQTCSGRNALWVKIPTAFYAVPVGLAGLPHGVVSLMKCWLSCFVLHNGPVGHSLFLVNFKQAGQSEFVLTLLTPNAFCLYQTLFLSFQKWNGSSFSCFLNIFLKDANLQKLFLKVELTGKVPSFVSRYLFVEFSKASPSETGDSISIYLERRLN